MPVDRTEATTGVLDSARCACSSAKDHIFFTLPVDMTPITTIANLAGVIGKRRPAMSTGAEVSRRHSLS